MRALALGCLLLAWCPVVSALDPELYIAQYAHATWRIREGFARAPPTALAQTADGYLWLGSEFGLSRFDGVRSVPWQPPAGAALPNNRIRALLAGRDGTLWIGTLWGLVSWRDGRLVRYPQFDRVAINALAEDRAGTVWVAVLEPPRSPGLCAIRKSGTTCEKGDRTFGDWLASLHVDGQDRLWATSAVGLWQLNAGNRKLYRVVGGLLGTLQGLADGENGAVLVATRGQIMQLAGSELSALPTAGPLPTQPGRLLRDRHGAVWAGSPDRGLMHIHKGRIDTFTRADGLSADAVQRIFEDREGNIWVATTEGLDRFSEVAATSYSVERGLPSPVVASVLETRDGSMWVSTRTGLSRWHDGRWEGVVARGLPDRSASLFEDSRGRLWVGADTGFGYLQNGRFTAVEAVPGPLIDSFAEDPHGTVWLAHRSAGLVSIAADGRIDTIPWSQFGREDGARRVAIDPLRGGLWLGFALGGVAHFGDGRVDMSMSAADGLPRGSVESLRVDHDGTLWVGGEGGLGRLKDGRMVALTASTGLPCDGVDWMIDEGATDVWLYTACGLLRMQRSDLDAAFAARERGMQPPVLPMKVFDSSDGVRTTLSVGSYSPHVARSRDGRLWFATPGGLSVLNPQRIPHNAIPPPVHIEQLIADRRSYDVSSATESIELPPLTRDLQIDYTALSLTAPERMRFRYRLLGFDPAWRDVGTRRQAFYTDLPPGNYLFQVIASNNDGVWNEVGASQSLAIAPTLYQTRGFTALCIALGAALLWLLVWWRGRQIEMRMRLRLEERVFERERIARDLHDTFLQSMQGLVLRFHAVLAKLPQDGVAHRMMEQALSRADEVIEEGRARVYDLRQSAHVTNDLPQALTAIGEERAETSATKFRVIIQGTPRHLHPVVREEAYRIGVEALANAFRHAAAHTIDVHIEYGRKGLTLRVVDDGRGYDVALLKNMVAEGHFGLAGLRERAHRIRAQLEVSSRPGAGSAVELRVPAAIAYATGRSRSSPDLEEVPWS